MLNVVRDHLEPTNAFVDHTLAQILRQFELSKNLPHSDFRKVQNVRNLSEIERWRLQISRAVMHSDDSLFDSRVVLSVGPLGPL